MFGQRDINYKPFSMVFDVGELTQLLSRGYSDRRYRHAAPVVERSRRAGSPTDGRAIMPNGMVAPSLNGIVVPQWIGEAST